MAYAAGKEAAQVNNAIRSYISENSLHTQEGTYQNISWLKSAAECGGDATGAVGYLPCNFSEELRLVLTIKSLLPITGLQLHRRWC